MFLIIYPIVCIIFWSLSVPLICMHFVCAFQFLFSFFLTDLSANISKCPVIHKKKKQKNCGENRCNFHKFPYTPFPAPSFRFYIHFTFFITSYISSHFVFFLIYFFIVTLSFLSGLITYLFKLYLMMMMLPLQCFHIASKRNRKTESQHF